jgi:hypothetical protein
VRRGRAGQRVTSRLRIATCRSVSIHVARSGSTVNVSSVPHFRLMGCGRARQRAAHVLRIAAIRHIRAEANGAITQITAGLGQV